MADLLPTTKRAPIDFSVDKGVQPTRSGSGVRACYCGWLIRGAPEQISNDSYREGGLEGSFWPHSELREGPVR
jgi:hypothetical protein